MLSPLSYQAIDTEESERDLENVYVHSSTEHRYVPPASVEYELPGQFSHNILSYDTKTLVLYGWMLPNRGSIFHRKIFAYITLQVVLSTIVAKLKCDETTGADDVMFCVPLPDNMTALTLLTVTSFLVGLFTNNLMQRWWQIRSALNNVKSKSLNLVSALTASIAMNTQHCPLRIRNQAICLTQTIKRYLQLAHALIYIRSNPVREYNEKLLRSRYLLTEREADLLLPKKSSKYKHLKSTTVYSWVLMCMEKASTSGFLGPIIGTAPTQHVVTFFNDLSMLQSAAIDVDMYITTQLPYPFIQLTALLVYTFLFQLFFVTSGIIGDGFSKGNPAIYITGYCTQILMSFVMLGVLHLYLVLSNPVGPDGADFPTSTYVLQYEEETNDLVESIWLASCPIDFEGATRSLLAKAPEEQLAFCGSQACRGLKKRNSGVDFGGLPVLHYLNTTPQDLRAY